MSAPVDAPPGATSRGATASTRRARYGLSSLVIVVCGAISMILANQIARDPRLHLAADVTATGEHRLAPRTTQVLNALPPGYEIVVCGAGSSDRDVRRRVADVLDSMARTRRLSVTWIDDPGGAEYAALIQRLVQRDRASLDQAAGTLSALAEEIDRAASLLDAIDGSLRDIEVVIPAGSGARAREQVTGFAAVARGLSTDARSAAESVRGAIVEPGGLGVPALDRAVSVCRRTLSRLASELQTLSTALTALAADESTPREAQVRARALATRVSLGRDPVALASDRAVGVEVPDLVRVARVLEGTESVLVVGPHSLGAVEFLTLFPATIPETVGGARADIGAAAEDLLTSAIVSLTSPAAPIVVLVHAEDMRLLDVGAISSLQARLALRRFEVVEWRVAAEPEPPGLAGLDPTGTRPVVYAALGTSSAAPASGPSRLSGSDRVQRLGAALRGLAQRGEPMLVSVSPSTLPAFGGTDACTSWLNELGLWVDSGRPLLTERVASGRRVVDADRIVTTLGPDDSDNHPIAGAASSLAIGLRWTIPLELRGAPEGTPVTLTPLIRVDSPQTWGEAQWLNFWQIPPEQRSMVQQPPAPDQTAGDDLTGPWTIAAAIEHAAPGRNSTHRLVVVGSNGWFFDALAAQNEVVNGRVSPTLPGNAELFEAAVYWLAGQESLIARSAASGSVPTVRPLSDTQALVIRWLVLGVLPVGVLVTGAAWRLAKG